MAKYPHAQACRDALERMGITTVQMCLSSTELGSRVDLACGAGVAKMGSSTGGSGSAGGSALKEQPRFHTEMWQLPQQTHSQPQVQAPGGKRKRPRFDMGFDELFSEVDEQSQSQRAPSIPRQDLADAAVLPHVPDPDPEPTFDELFQPQSQPQPQGKRRGISPTSTNPPTLTHGTQQSEIESKSIDSMDFFDFGFEHIAALQDGVGFNDHLGTGLGNGLGDADVKSEFGTNPAPGLAADAGIGLGDTGACDFDLIDAFLAV